MQTPDQHTKHDQPQADESRLTRRDKAIVAGMLLVPVLFVAFVVGMTYFVAADVTDQYETQDFVPVDATIISSRSVSRPTTDGRSNYEIEIEYRYTVGDQTYSADTFRFGPRSTSSFWVVEQVRAFPAGSQRVAFVDPDDPTRAVLDNSFTLGDLTILSVLSVFYGVIAVGIVGVIHIVRFCTGDLPPFVGAQIFRDAPDITRIRPHQSPPSYRAAGFGLLLLFGSVFLLYFVVIRFDDRAILFPITLGVIAALALVKWVFLVWPRRRPARELTVDRRKGVIVGPHSPDNPGRTEILIADIAAITTDRRDRHVIATLKSADRAEGESAELVKFKPGKKELARKLAADLAELIGMPNPGPE
jgi:hypothetical protein